MVSINSRIAVISHQLIKILGQDKLYDSLERIDNSTRVCACQPVILAGKYKEDVAFTSTNFVGVEMAK